MLFSKIWSTLSTIILKNGQTCFKNLVVWKFYVWPAWWIKRLRYFIFNDHQSTTATDPRKKICYYDTHKLYQNNCFLSSCSVSSEKSETLERFFLIFTCLINLLSWYGVVPTHFVLNVAFSNKAVAFCNKYLSHFVLKWLRHSVTTSAVFCSKVL